MSSILALSSASVSSVPAMHALQVQMVEMLKEYKALDVLILDVHALTSWADTFLICTATSNRHAKAIAKALVKRVKAHGIRPSSLEGLEAGEWVLINLAGIIIHIMLKEQREWYQLEKLWTPLSETQN